MIWLLLPVGLFAIGMAIGAIVAYLERRNRPEESPAAANHLEPTEAAALAQSSGSAWREPSRADDLRKKMGAASPPASPDAPPPTLHSVLLQCDELLEERDNEISRLKLELLRAQNIEELVEGERDAAEKDRRAAIDLRDAAVADREVSLQELFAIDKALVRLLGEFKLNLADLDGDRQWVINYVVDFKIAKLKRQLKAARSAADRARAAYKKQSGAPVRKK